MGAASGLFAALLFVVAFVIFLSTHPGGGNTPALPDIANAQAVPAFFADHLQPIRAQVMLNSLGIILFLWFLGTLWSVLRRAEGGPARGSAIASAGGLIGVAMTLVGLMLTATATLTTSLPMAEAVPTLYAAAAVSFAFAGAAFAVLYLGVAEVSLRVGGVPRWLGMLSILAAVVSIFGVITPYFTSGVFNPATGAVGFYAHYIVFVLWVLMTGAVLTFSQYHSKKAVGHEVEPTPTATATEGADS
jgi:hypothetical protein